MQNTKVEVSVMGCLCQMLGCTNQTLETINLVAVALCYMLCAFSYLTFNKLVLLSIPMPCLVAAIQMGATCVLLLIVNGAVGALCHSRTSRIVRASVADAIMLVVSVCYKALVLVCCIKTDGMYFSFPHGLPESKETAAGWTAE